MSDFMTATGVLIALAVALTTWSGARCRWMCCPDVADAASDIEAALANPRTPNDSHSNDLGAVDGRNPRTHTTPGLPHE